MNLDKVPDFEAMLEVYSVEEILEMAELTTEQALVLLWERGLLELPEVLPL